MRVVAIHMLSRYLAEQHQSQQLMKLVMCTGGHVAGDEADHGQEAGHVHYVHIWHLTKQQQQQQQQQQLLKLLSPTFLGMLSKE